MAKQDRQEPDRGSPRVEGWVYAVINPLLEAIPIEISFLERGNITWRFYNQQMEYLRPIAGYLTPDGRHILRDFSMANREAKTPLEKHDEFLHVAMKAAQRAHSELVNRKDFLAKVSAALTEFVEADAKKTYPGGAFPETKFPGLVAEHVVNEVQEIPSHYTDSRFWKRYSGEFLTFAHGLPFEELQRARASLLEHDRSLLEWLEKKSYELCMRHDLPAAPLSGSF